MTGVQTCALPIFIFMQAAGFDPIFAPLEGTDALRVGLMANKNEVAKIGRASCRERV